MYFSQRNIRRARFNSCRNSSIFPSVNATAAGEKIHCKHGRDNRPYDRLDPMNRATAVETPLADAVVDMCVHSVGVDPRDGRDGNEGGLGPETLSKLSGSWSGFLFYPQVWGFWQTGIADVY